MRTGSQAAGALGITLEPVRDFEALGQSWRELESRAGAIPPFRTWTWVGCLAEERYSDPVLLRAERDGRTVGLALFNRRRGRLHLAESGEAALDAPLVEHNAPLVSADAGPAVALALLRAAWTLGAARRVVLSGVEETLVTGGAAWRHHARPAPFVDLDRVRAAGGDPLAHLSANARQQIRRSMRRFVVEAGELALARATTVAEALDWLDALIGLHQQTWRARGEPGAFATAFMVRFHRGLVARAMPYDEVDLLRLSAGATVLGYLYNLRRDGHVCAYQGGFDRAAADSHRKPGLVAHVLAIGRAAAEGARLYDFLAGEARYKRSLATGFQTLVWAELVRSWSPLGLCAPAMRWLRRGS